MRFALFERAETGTREKKTEEVFFALVPVSARPKYQKGIRSH